MPKCEQPGAVTPGIAEADLSRFVGPGRSEPVPVRDLHPMNPSDFHGALFQQQTGSALRLRLVKWKVYLLRALRRIEDALNIRGGFF